MNQYQPSLSIIKTYSFNSLRSSSISKMVCTILIPFTIFHSYQQFNKMVDFATIQWKKTGGALHESPGRGRSAVSGLWEMSTKYIKVYGIWGVSQIGVYLNTPQSGHWMAIEWGKTWSSHLAHLIFRRTHIDMNSKKCWFPILGKCTLD